MKKCYILCLACFLLLLTACEGNTKETTQKANETKKQEETTLNSSEAKPTTTADTAKPEPKKDESIKSGMYKVGTDLPAGEYFLLAEQGQSAYFAVLKDSTGSSNNILQNDNFATFRFLTVEDGQYLQLKRAKMLPATKVEKIPLDGKELIPGMYRVGIDVPAGEYKLVPNDGATGYYSLHANSTVNGLKNIISNDNFKEERYLTIQEGQYLKLNRASLLLPN
ncbi:MULTISPECIES: hypothetical protein [Bacillus]|uniref:hypothetical protein n=1 Tax=Bacillus TaxID=1386 RepID=UPI0010FF7AA1|nr:MULTISPECIES: hypothetical protein [Bacillus]MDA1585960.1 hypothetical protein [Bacillus cereus group sp. TH230-1LC]MBP3970721.1 hypothetical protein [Bacillus sp. WL1]QCU12554.1 hypothetical protein BCPR1_23440 [Bacillus paranthracis]UOB79753.1 hypothetical protein MQW34_03995 [Bacillus sp. ZJS3]HDR4708213.1 hypothetical protein [Bacillus paranthracis]